MEKKKVINTIKDKLDPTVNEKIEQLHDKAIVDNTGKELTTEQGLLVEDTDNSLKAGARGPVIMEDFIFREKMTSFDHERIPERVVHARGAGAHGFFEVYQDMGKYTKAAFLRDPSLKTPVFVRFSTVVGSRGSADTVRDVRGFATKFFTPEGNYDLVGNNMPPFFIQDAIKFPDLVHSIKPEPHHEIPQASAAHDNFWDFVSLTPESTHMLMWVLSDRALPRSFAHMEGFGVHTFRWINDAGESRFVKYHWKPLLGVHSQVWDEAQKTAGADPDYHRREMWESIEKGIPYEYELGVQIIEEKDVERFEFDLLDPTKLVPEEQFPIMKVGKMTLNRNPDNFFLETEQIAFDPGNIVPGIDLSNDPLLQGRVFSYIDTQLTRLGGPNFAQIPINRPVAKVSNNTQDGFMRQTNMKGRVNYFPSSLGGPITAKQGGFHHHPEKVEGTKIRARSATFSDHYSQATLFYNSMSEVEKQHIIDAACFELGKVETKHVREQMVMNLMNVDETMAKKVAERIGVEAKMPEQKHSYRGSLKVSKALSQTEGQPTMAKGRKVCVLIADGFSYQDYQALKEAMEAESAMIEPVSSKLGMIRSKEGKEVEVKKTFITSAPYLFDGLYVPGGAESVKSLMAAPKSIMFINETYRHNKALAFSDEAIEIFKKSTIAQMIKPEKLNAADLFNENGLFYHKSRHQDFTTQFVQAISAHRHWKRQGELLPG
jgi:catalase